MWSNNYSYWPDDLWTFCPFGFASIEPKALTVDIVHSFSFNTVSKNLMNKLTINSCLVTQGWGTSSPRTYLLCVCVCVRVIPVFFHTISHHHRSGKPGTGISIRCLIHTTVRCRTGGTPSCYSIGLVRARFDYSGPRIEAATGRPSWRRIPAKSSQRQPLQVVNIVRNKCPSLGYAQSQVSHPCADHTLCSITILLWRQSTSWRHVKLLFDVMCVKGVSVLEQQKHVADRNNLETKWNSYNPNIYHLWKQRCFETVKVIQ